MVRPRVLILLTGGTLAMAVSREGVLETGEVFAIQIGQALPELAEIAQVDTRTLMMKDSSDMRPEDWARIASEIRASYQSYDGFVVVHGTDTMAYTASAVSFMLPSASKPVVFTGSQRPLREPRSDARVNLVDAVTVATMAVPEVTVCMHSTLLRGNRCRKRSTHAYDAFESPNLPPLGHLGVEVELSDDILPARGVPGLPLPRPLPVEEKVSLIFLSPTTRREELAAHRDLGTRGLVLLGYGSGNLPVAEGALMGAIGSLGIPVIVSTQCYEGPVDMGLYRGGKAILDAGAIDGGDMTPEAALTKLMAGLGVGLGDAELREYLLNSVAGERRPWREDAS